MAKKHSAGDTREVRIKPRPTAVLLEVSSDWIKVLEITSQRSGLTISKAYLEQVDESTRVAESLKKAFKKMKFSRVPLLCSIPRQLVNVRLLELPSVDPTEIKDMVELQVSRQTPYSIQEILSGVKMLGQTRKGTYTRVLLAIVQRTVVRERYYAIEDAGLAVERMGVSSEGVLSWVLYHTRSMPAENVVLSLDVDSYFTHMLVIRNHQVIFTKSLLWGAKQADAGVDAFVGRVQEAARSCEDVLQGKGFDVVLLSGAESARRPDMVSALQDSLQVSCESVDPLQELKVHSATDAQLTKEVRSSVSLTGLIGMALDPGKLALHFVPDVYAMRQRLLFLGKGWAGLLSGVAALLVAASLFFSLGAWNRMQYLEELTVETELLRPQVMQIERRLEILRATRGRQEAYVMPEHLLPVIHAAVPEGVFLDSLSLHMENGRFSIQGSAPQRRAIRDVIRLLEDTPYFTQVEEAGGTSMDNRERFRFQINGSITGGQSS